MTPRGEPSARLRLLELFCGIGGCAAALRGAVEVVGGIDSNRGALEVLEANFSHPALARNIEFLPADALAAFGADLWWLSPPCQPYTRRGKRRELDDPRARCFPPLLEHIAELRPPYLALENVPGFEGSQAHALLTRTLEGAGYALRQGLLCPSDLGWPNRRRRYYLVASRGGWVAGESPFQPGLASGPPKPSLADCLGSDLESEEELRVPDALARRYEGVWHLVDAEDPRAVTACFTSAYGRSHVRSGSYLRQGGELRRFAPREILSLLGFPRSFRLPSALPVKKAWPLVGNSLSLPVVRRVLSCLPPLSAALGSETR